MKKSHILAVVIIGIAISIIVSTSGNTSQYVDFGEAFALAESGSSAKVHVVGQLKKDSEGNIQGMKYRPEMDPNFFEFVLVDNKNRETIVQYGQPKPQDIERSEQVVIVGSARGDIFVADKILLKCPSKYEENEVKAGY
ncbi:cytochrome c maturation protein CcmE [Cytophagaceae bacterium ABcell3]|nr:cytochrome c maturation protein CcmE [Cytophagaceae bacterium ABcell3]